MPPEVENKPEKPRNDQTSGDGAGKQLFEDSFPPPPSVSDTSKKTEINKDELPKVGDAPASPGTPPGTAPASDPMQAQLDAGVDATKKLYEAAALSAAALLGDPAAFAKLGTAALKHLASGRKGDAMPAGPKGPAEKPIAPGANTRGISPPNGKPGGGDGPIVSMTRADAPEDTFMSPDPDDTPESGKKGSEPTRAGSDDNGKRLTTSVNVAGVGTVDFEATRGKDNRVNSLDMKIGDDKFTLKKGDDGSWKFQQGSGTKVGEEKARKALETLGIKPDATGNFSGKLDITADGNLRYQNSDRPDKQVTYLGQNGKAAKYDYGDYTRTITDKGQKSVDAWNGREFVPVDGDIKKTTNKDGSVTSSATLKSGPNQKIERTTHPGEPTTGAGKRDDVTVTKRNADGTAGEVSQYKFLEGTKTTNGKTTYLDGTTGKYREGKKEGNKVTFTDGDTGSKASSVTRDAKAGTVTYAGKNGFELTKNINNDQILSSATSEGKFNFEYDAESGKGSSGINKFTFNGHSFTRVGSNRDGTNHEIAEGRKSLGDFNPKTSELNTYRDNQTGQAVKMSVAVGQDGTVKIAREGRRGDDRSATQEFKPQGEKSFSRPQDLKKADANLTVKKDATGAPAEYQHASANLKLSKSEDGSWTAEALDAKKPFTKPTDFQKDVYTSNNLDAAQKLRLVENSKKFDEMKKFTPQQKQEVYKQADRLLNGRQDSAIPANEQAALADQLFWHVTNPGRNDQGYNNTCNTTVLRSLALKDKPEVVAKLAADVANDGQFKTSAGKEIKIPGDSVRARPGSPESTFPPADGTRSALGKLWDVSAINSVYQTDSNGAHRYVEHASEARGDTGGRQYLTDKDGKEHVLYTRGKDGGEKPNDNPGMSSSKIADAWKHLTGEKLTGRFLSHENRQMSHPDIVSGKFTTPEQLHGHLVANNNAGGKPVVVQGNTGKLDQIAKNLPQPTQGGEHVWVVSHYDAQTRTATIQNSWGTGNDIKMSLNDLHTAMQTKSHNPLSDRTPFWKPVQSSGSDRARRLNG